MKRDPSFTPGGARLPLVAALLAALPALAQQAPPADSGQVETVTITATKRPQPLQTTPIAISVLNGEALEQENVNTVAAVTALAPTVNFRTNASNKDSALFIRGVGTISTSPGVEPTVSMVIDGVVTGRPGQATMDLLDIERIEILRGPQGTLFGKNASAGVINIVSKAPSKDTERYVDLSYFQGNERRLRVGASGELKKDLLRGSIAAMKAKYDGNVTNVFNGAKVNGYDRQGLRGRLDVTPTRDLKVSLIADYAKAKDNTPTGVVTNTTTTAYGTGIVTQNPLFAAALAPVVASASNRQINSDTGTDVTDTNSGVSAQVDWQLGDGLQLTSISAYRGWTNVQHQDQDRLGTVYKQFAGTADVGNLAYRQVSQELRVASNKAGFVDYVAGLFFIDGKDNERYERDVTRCAGTTAAALPSGLIPCSPGSTTLDNGIAVYGTHSQSSSAFGEGTFNFTPTLRGIAGMRYTSDDLSFYHERTATAAGVPGVAGTQPELTGATRRHAFSGRIGPQWQITPDVMTYMTLSRGYKGPAYNVFFNMTTLQTNALNPETSNSVEVGVKSTLLDKTVRLNVAVFDTQYDNYQANVPDNVNGTVVTRLINAGQVTTKGVEVDATARVTPQLTLNAALANIIARVKNFNCPTILSPAAALSCNINGQPLPFAPDWKTNLSAKYTLPLSSDLLMDLNLDYSWQSKTQYDLAQSPDAIQPAYGIVNASVGVASLAGWRVALIGKNLANRSYATFLQNSGNNINRYVPRDDQRYFGISAHYDF
ncbi:MAG: TonB-dependent receptor [Burkholderiales bacterium]|nr:TonB-dependent receptor [Burkholderiales bacterium]MDE1928251.1 TonB-dependent receptor [Burkholderiales bacterium]MDE2503089.1 TonB-dependent receptor [Burkholderiales bacterium]